MLHFKWKLFTGFVTFGIIVVVLTALQHRFVGHTLTAVLFTVLASLVPAFFIGWRLNRPVRLLGEGIARVARGDLDVTLPRLHTRDEFEPLIDRFNRMVVALRETEHLRESLAVQEQVGRVLREDGERLEARVHERTRELEQAIRERDRYVAQSLDLICVATFDGWFKSVNPAFERVLGYTPDEMTSGPFLQFVHPDDVARTVSEMKGLGAGIPTVMFENRYRCKDGSYKWLQWTAIPLTEEGVISAIARDITDKRRAEAAEEALLESSLQMRIAQGIQASLLPVDQVHLEGFDVAGVWRPAGQVGGDHFDFIPTHGNRMVIVMADASGHGLASALVMAQLHACLWSLLAIEPHPIEEVLARANAMLVAKTPDNCFATAVLVDIDSSSGTMTCASCGHPPAYLLDRDGHVKSRIESSGRPLGCFPDFEVRATSAVSLQAGDTLVLMTDGILEAESLDGELFGEERVLDVVRRHLGGSAREIADAVQSRIECFCDRRQDDATLVVMKVTSEQPQAAHVICPREAEAGADSVRL
jgi:sigma-B regulation protein RsbU (phosphoserine phosphatase)